MELAVGDITKPDLGLDSVSRLKEQTSEVFHLAAVYDLSVPRDVGMRVNVTGTRNVLDFAESARRLRRLHYVSTCYVSGRYAGIFSEADLEKGQSFNNYYEETKYLAEVEVQGRMRGGLSATVYRPAVVVGDSRTGATQKYDGPYYVIRWLLKQPSVAVLPVDIGWDDIGNWAQLSRLLSRDQRDNLVHGGGRTVLVDTTGTYVYSSGKRLVATAGVQDLVIVAVKTTALGSIAVPRSGMRLTASSIETAAPETTQARSAAPSGEASVTLTLPDNLGHCEDLT